MIYEPYAERPPLDRYYFEDSWVLDVAVADRSAVVTVDAVLTPQHPNFGPPVPGDQHRYERIALHFADAKRVSFEPSYAKAAVDASGELDLGNIDTFGAGDSGAFVLEGAWGTLELDGATLTIDPLL